MAATIKGIRRRFAVLAKKHKVTVAEVVRANHKILPADMKLAQPTVWHALNNEKREPNAKTVFHLHETISILELDYKCGAFAPKKRGQRL